MLRALGPFISVLTSRRLYVFISSFFATVVFGLFDFNVSRWTIESTLAPELKAAFQATIVGMGAGIALWFLLESVRQRRKLVAEELERVSELNHAIRNSLEIIVLAHYTEANAEHRALILECTKRIDQKLKELYPIVRPAPNP